MGCRTVTDTLPVLRGRMLAGEQMTRLSADRGAAPARWGVPRAVPHDDGRSRRGDREA